MTRADIVAMKERAEKYIASWHGDRRFVGRDEEIVSLADLALRLIEDLTGMVSNACSRTTKGMLDANGMSTTMDAMETLAEVGVLRINTRRGNLMLLATWTDEEAKG